MTRLRFRKTWTSRPRRKAATSPSGSDGAARWREHWRLSVSKKGGAFALEAFFHVVRKMGGAYLHWRLSSVSKKGGASVAVQARVAGVRIQN